MIASLPPISATTRLIQICPLRGFAASSLIRSPTSREPVNETNRVLGCSTKVSPTFAPLPELRGDTERFERFRARWLGNDPLSYATIWRMLANADMQKALGEVRCPALVIAGNLDRVRPPPMAQEIAKAIPGARYVEVRTGHYMAVQTPDLIANCIDDFLKSVDA